MIPGHSNFFETQHFIYIFSIAAPKTMFYIPYVPRFKHFKIHPRSLLKLSHARHFHCTKNEVFLDGFLQLISPNPQETADLITFTEKIHSAQF